MTWVFSQLRKNPVDHLFFNLPGYIEAIKKARCLSKASMLAQRSPFRYLPLGAAVSLLVLTFLFFGVRSGGSVAYILKSSKPQCVSYEPSSSQDSSWEFDVARDGLNYGLSEAQCFSAFPKLFNETNKSALLRQDNQFTYKDLDSRNVEDGMVRGIIEQGQVRFTDAREHF